jgi:hypothetical protein
MDYEALGVLQPGAVVLVSAQLGEPDPLGQVSEDPLLQDWLRRRQEIVQVVRLWPMKTPEDPEHVAARIVRLHRAYPWLEWFIPANEPDIEWPDPSWRRIARWTREVWQRVEWHRRNAGVSRIKLLFPPLSQGSRLDPERVGYDALRPSIEVYLDHGDGIAGHAYWDRGKVDLVEDAWPAWLRERLGAVPFFVTEAGRRPVMENGSPDHPLGEELLDFSRRTCAQVIAPFILSSADGRFDAHAFVDMRGQLRAPLYVWGRWGP